jgi:hypothetical protein
MNRRKFLALGVTAAVLFSAPNSLSKPRCDASYIERKIKEQGALPPGNYVVSRPIVLSSSAKIVGSTFLVSDEINSAMFVFGSTPETIGLIEIRNCIFTFTRV